MTETKSTFQSVQTDFYCNHIERTVIEKKDCNSYFPFFKYHMVHHNIIWYCNLQHQHQKKKKKK